MNISLNDALAIGSACIAIGGAWALVRVSRSDIRNIWTVIGNMRIWQEKHTEESSAVRLELQKEIGNLQLADGKAEERFSAIMGILTEIKDDLRLLKK